MTLYQVAEEISRRLANIFLKDKNGRRPVYGGTKLQRGAVHAQARRRSPRSGKHPLRLLHRPQERKQLERPPPALPQAFGAVGIGGELRSMVYAISGLCV